MNANRFIETLRNHSEQPLLFQVSSGAIVQGGFHVTEIKNASYRNDRLWQQPFILGGSDRPALGPGRGDQRRRAHDRR
jgi:hypothetical protein